MVVYSFNRKNVSEENDIRATSEHERDGDEGGEGGWGGMKAKTD